MSRFKQPGRPKNSPNNRSGVVRDRAVSIRVSEGCRKTIDALIEHKGYTTTSDVIHEAIQQLGYKKLQAPTEIYWLSKIQ